jgi:predicted ester cyclase
LRRTAVVAVLMIACLPALASAQAPARVDNKAIARRYFDEILNKGSAAALDSIIAADVVFRNPPAVVKGIAEFRKLIASLRGAFPDLHFTLEDELAEGNKVATRWVMRGTQGARKVDVRHLSDRERENQGDLGEYGFAGASAADGRCARAMTMMQ